MSDRGLIVDVLLYDGARLYDVATALEVFADRSIRGFPVHSLRLVGSNTRVRTDPAAAFTVERPSDHSDLLIVPGSDRRLGRLADVELELIRGAAGSGVTVASLCTGAFALAEAGVLDGRRATTHWRYAAELARRFPLVEVVPDEIYVGDGLIWSSAGVSAGVDLLLHLVAEKCGVVMANDIAKSMVTPLRRAGNQAQFITHEITDADSADLRELEARIRRDPAADWSVRRLARELGMSERSCFRHFRSGTGASPAEWITGVRIDCAREHLETTSAGMEQIAHESGLGSADNLRKRFVARFGLSPSAYRARFALAG